MSEASVRGGTAGGLYPCSHTERPQREHLPPPAAALNFSLWPRQQRMEIFPRGWGMAGVHY